jgi:DNA adenine methylase
MIDAKLKKQSGNLKPIFSRVGSKFSLIQKVLQFIPPHTIYVEPFVGGGSIFWNKTPAEKSVINDIDDELVDAYRNLKSAPISQLQELYYLDKPSNQTHKNYKSPEYKQSVSNLVASLDDINSNSTSAEQLLKYFKVSRGTFNQLRKGKVYRNISFRPYIANIEKYKKLIEDVTITNNDYIDIIYEYDSPTTFFFLDPPYEESDTHILYKQNGTIDYENMRQVLRTIQGKFLLTINDSEYIRDTFKEFNQQEVSVTNKSNSPDLKTKGRKELFIFN